MASTFESANFDSALSRLRAGHMIIVIDDPDRENEGDLVMASPRLSDSHLWSATPQVLSAHP